MGAALGRKLCPYRDRAGRRLFEWGLHRPEGHVLGSSGPLDRRQKVPADKVLVVSWYKVLFPAAISVSPDLAVLDGSKTLAGTPPKHPCPRKVTGEAPHRPPPRFLLAAEKGGITCWWDNGAQLPRRSTTRTSAEVKGDKQRTWGITSGHGQNQRTDAPSPPLPSPPPPLHIAVYPLLASHPDLRPSHT